MRTVAISAVLLGVAHVSVAAAAMPAVAMDDGQGATLARAGASSFLEVPDTRQSALLPVGEGGEGGRGRWRRGGPPRGYGWGPPPRGYYYAPPPPRYYRPPPPVYYAPPPRAYYYAPPPPMYYAPQPGVSLNFRF